MVTYFKYLGQILTSSNDNFPEFMGNLQKAQKSWTRLSTILVREGGGPGVSRIFFKAVVQAVLVFRAKTWVMIPLMVRALGGFQHRVSRHTTGSKPQRFLGGSW